MTDDAPKLPKRPTDGHKGTFGTVCVIGGQATPLQTTHGAPTPWKLVTAEPRPLVLDPFIQQSV